MRCWWLTVDMRVLFGFRMQQIILFGFGVQRIIQYGFGVHRNDHHTGISSSSRTSHGDSKCNSMIEAWYGSGNLAEMICCTPLEEHSYQ